MRIGRLVSLAMIALGAALLLWAALQGDLNVYILLIIPILTGTGPAAALGTLLLIAGIFTWILTRFTVGSHPPSSPTTSTHDAPTSPPPQEKESKSAGIILIGPIPIAWGSDRKTLLLVLIAAIGLILTATLALWLLA